MKKLLVILGLALILLFSGCAIKTVDEMYCLPRRSEDYDRLQGAIDRVLGSLSYCAPIQGENRQTVQFADLTGDGEAEAIVFAKGTDENPLKIFVFEKQDGVYTDIAALKFPGTAFTQVEYVQMDGLPGLELVVGRQMGAELLHSLSAYAFREEGAAPVFTAGYTHYITADLDSDGCQEVFLLRPGSGGVSGVAELYRAVGGRMEPAQEAAMSVPVEGLKRIAEGGLWGGSQAVFVASSYDEQTIITDVYAVVDGRFTNISLSPDAAASVRTIRDYGVYACDLDADGLMELPALRRREPGGVLPQSFIRWYNLSPSGEEHEKAFTYHNYAQRWYVLLDGSWNGQVRVQPEESREKAVGYAFVLGGRPVFAVYAYTGENRQTDAQAEDGFILGSTEEVTFGGVLLEGAEEAGVTRQSLTQAFHFIRQDWKTGET